MPALAAALIAATLVWVYWEGLERYLRDQHYQEHFAYLWCFAALTLWQTLRGPFRRSFDPGKKRDLAGLTLALLASLTLLVAQAVGSSTATRSSLVMLLTALALVTVARWSVARCLMHGALLQFCFGIPYSFYFPLTNKLRWGISTLVGLPADFGLADYRMDGPVVRFPHYDLEITADCSGVGQLLTFLGIAALGILSSSSSARRIVGIVALAVVLAWLSNLMRVGMFVLLVSLGWTASIDDPTWHSLIGFLVFLPFVIALVAVILKTQTPLPSFESTTAPPGRFHVAWMVLPVALASLLAKPDVPELHEPTYYAQLSEPPGHTMTVVAKTQESDRRAYETPWLISARFERSQQDWFDLFHYRTRSQSHLCVHHVSDCLERENQSVTYAPSIDVDGKEWWPIALDAPTESDSWHVYFAFEVGSKRRDDSLMTQLATVYNRAILGNWDVDLTRVMFRGRLPAEPTPYETEVLSWLGRTITPQASEQ